MKASIYGLYKFQITYHNLTRQQSKAVWERLKARRRKLYNSSIKKCQYVYTLEDGVEIFFRTHKSRIIHIDVVVFPQMVMHMEDSHIMFGATTFLPELGSKINKAITRELGPDYTMDKFVMTSVECGVNFYPPKMFSSEYCISIIERSIRYMENDHVVKLKTYENETRIKDKHGYRLETGDMVFTVHDKFFRTEYGYSIYEEMPKSMLNLRIELNNRHINRAVNDNNLPDLWAVLKYYIEYSQRIIDNFINKHFLSGDYCPYQLLKQCLDESTFPPKLRMQMGLCVDYFHSHKNAKGFNKNMENLFT